MKRRTLIGASVAGLLVSGPAARANASRPLLVYVGGWDCPSCITWKNNKKPAFVASPLATKVRLVEVEAPRLREAYQPGYWPDDVKFVLELIPKEQRRGTPRFLIVRGGKIVLNRWGGGEWDRVIASLEKL
jgi:hypothetical protein